MSDREKDDKVAEQRDYKLLSGKTKAAVESMLIRAKRQYKNGERDRAFSTIDSAEEKVFKYMEAIGCKARGGHHLIAVARCASECARLIREVYGARETIKNGEKHHE